MTAYFNNWYGMLRSILQMTNDQLLMISGPIKLLFMSGKGNSNVSETLVVSIIDGNMFSFSSSSSSP